MCVCTHPSKFHVADIGYCLSCRCSKFEQKCVSCNAAANASGLCNHCEARSNWHT